MMFEWNARRNEKDGERKPKFLFDVKSQQKPAKSLDKIKAKRRMTRFEKFKQRFTKIPTKELPNWQHASDAFEQKRLNKLKTRS